jgi:uncharacterized protein (TIGR00159 family)
MNYIKGQIYNSLFIFFPLNNYNILSLKLSLIPPWLINILDFGLVFFLIYLVLIIIDQGSSLWVIRGFIFLMVSAVITKKLGLVLLSFVLEKLVLGSSIVLGILFQSQLRRFLELLGKGDLRELLKPPKGANASSATVIEELVDAVKELSQNRTGALMVLEIVGTIDEQDFINPGVPINADISKELLQTIFQTSTPLHDGAVFIRDSSIISAAVILPLSEQTTSRKLGTRHRAAMGITERINNCICVVVSEETGSISLAFRGKLDRPLTSSKLKELLEQKLISTNNRESVTPQLSRLSRTIGLSGKILVKNIFNLPSFFSKHRK